MIELFPRCFPTFAYLYFVLLCSNILFFCDVSLIYFILSSFFLFFSYMTLANIPPEGMGVLGVHAFSEGELDDVLSGTRPRIGPKISWISGWG
jgi:hypothetical protein